MIVLNSCDKDTALNIDVLCILVEAPKRRVLAEIQKLTKFKIVAGELRFEDGKPQLYYWLPASVGTTGTGTSNTSDVIN